MSGLISSFEDFAKSIEQKVGNLNTLINDMEAMKNGIKNNKPYSRQTIEPMTRLRKNKEELVIAKEKPDEQFIRDVLSDVLGIQ